MVLLQGPGPYKREREIYKRPAKTTVKERKKLKQSIKEYQETIYCNIILARPTVGNNIICYSTSVVRNFKLLAFPHPLSKNQLKYNIILAINCSYMISPYETNIDQQLTSQLAIDQLGNQKRLDYNSSESKLITRKC